MAGNRLCRRGFHADDLFPGQVIRPGNIWEIQLYSHLGRPFRIEKLGVKVGVAINPSTDLIRLENIVDIVDVVQIMTVNPGFGGQTFMKDQLDKIRTLKRKIDELGLSVRIAADGGINSETAPLAVQAGASILVAGSSIYNKESSVEENMKLLTESIMHEARVY